MDRDMETAGNLISCMNGQCNCSKHDAPDLMIAAALREARQEGVRLGVGSLEEFKKDADRQNELHYKSGMEKAAKMFSDVCGVNPYTLRPCADKMTDKRYMCPVCIRVTEIRAAKERDK